MGGGGGGGGEHRASAPYNMQLIACVDIAATMCNVL